MIQNDDNSSTVSQLLPSELEEKEPPLLLCVPSLHQSFVWELLGTSLYTVGALMDTTPIGKAISMSVAFMLVYQMTGGQLNPIMSMNLYLRKMIDIKLCFVNMAAQLLGAFLGGMLVYTSNVGEAIKAPHFQTGLTDIQAYLQEIIGSFFFVLMMNIQQCRTSQLTDDTFMFAIFFAMVMFTARQCAMGTGGILNPALAIGLNLCVLSVTQGWEDDNKIWIYLTAPFIGSLLAFLFFTYAFLPTLKTAQVYQAKHPHPARIT